MDPLTREFLKFVLSKDGQEIVVKDGYLPMRGYGWHKVMQGETTIEEVVSVTSSDIGGAD